MVALLRRCRKMNLKLNPEKLKLKLTEVPYMDHLLTSEGLKPDAEKIRAVKDMPKADGKTRAEKVKAVQRFLGGGSVVLKKFFVFNVEKSWEKLIDSVKIVDTVLSRRFITPEMKGTGTISFDTAKRYGTLIVNTCSVELTFPVTESYSKSPEIFIESFTEDMGIGTGFGMVGLHKILLGIQSNIYGPSYLPKLSDVAEPLRRLTDKDAVWCWERHHQEAFDRMKEMIIQFPVLRYYDVNLPVTIQCDSSDIGLRACIMQEGRLIPFASRTLSPVETNSYAPIEKECVAIVLAC
eukprot:gene2127-2414_t